MSMLLKAVAGLAALLAIFAYRSGRLVWNNILTRPALPPAHYAFGDASSHCHLIQHPSHDVSSCEDIAFWDLLDSRGALADRLLLLGCDPNRKSWNTVMGPLRDPAPRGHLFLYDPRGHRDRGALRRLVLAGYPADHDFHPLGMDVMPSRDGAPSTLFVVNHARARTTVEQFVLDPAALGRQGKAEAEAEGEAGVEVEVEARYVRTLRSPYFIAPNAIAATSPSSFFVSNDHLVTRRLPGLVGRVVPLVETIAGFPLGWVAHVSVHESTPGVVVDAETPDDDYTLTHTFAALGIPFANGIALSPAHDRLAVSSTSLGVVYFYNVSATTLAEDAAPKLAWTDTVPVPFFPDNVAYDDAGALILAGHPHFPSLVDVAANKTGAYAPSWAVSITPASSSSSESHVVETLFQSDGSVFGSSSTTLRDARTGTIYVAGLYERGILTCRP